MAEKVPLYLRGRGRGRGRGKPFAASRGEKQQSSPPGGLQEDDIVSVNETEDDDANEDEILSTVWKQYNEQGALKTEDSQASRMVQELCQSGGICLICLEDIGKGDPVWNCSGCFETLHMACIQLWIRDGVKQRVLSEEAFPDLEVPWHCPKCRKEYAQKEFPTKYKCFCGKTTDPEFDPWITPHSCGQVCNRALQPYCGHSCLLLCHPGSCPPCPQTVSALCFCGANKEVRRCGEKQWSCGGVCGRLLSCGLHRCKKNCHDGPCGGCTEIVERSCKCGKRSKRLSCAESVWSCEQPCGKKHTCGKHACERDCHDGPCGECPHLQTTCPCGKNPHVGADCSKPAPTCSNTCGKMLPCGLHTCPDKCHQGPCTLCRHVVTKTCPCGKTTKDLPCHADINCKHKCNRMRGCARHQCKRKCCDGNCPSCEEVCGRRLKCGNHKCVSVCHEGPCFPCPQKQPSFCACGKTKKVVPCGREKSCIPPVCKEPCTKPPNCRHPKRAPHRCHFGECPPCTQPCLQLHLKCKHQCGQPCHDTSDGKDRIVVNPLGEKKRISGTNPACPPCKVPAEITCLGLHTTKTVPCHKVEPFSCSQNCGRSMSCGRHKCEARCHSPEDANWNWEQIDRAMAEKGPAANKGCKTCKLPCSQPRPEKCTHKCPKLCHEGACEPCQKTVKVKCHCGNLPFTFKCLEYCKLTTKELNTKISCKNRCSYNMSCGHRCPEICHPGKCPDAKVCKKKVSIACKCGKLKKDEVCKGRKSLEQLECTEECKRTNTIDESEGDDSEEEVNNTTGISQEEKQALREAGRKRRREKREERLRKANMKKNSMPPYVKALAFAGAAIVLAFIIRIVTEA
eukprot:m.166582 g.166582  ORF g.166582 m.166582 type:complete len:849 (+) comp15285_c0_seq1:177-2723(+)